MAWQLLVQRHLSATSLLDLIPDGVGDRRCVQRPPRKMRGIPSLVRLLGRAHVVTAAADCDGVAGTVPCLDGRRHRRSR